MVSPKPQAGRPHMPGYGILDASQGKVLPWSWAKEHLSKGRNYFFATNPPAASTPAPMARSPNRSMTLY